MRRVPSSTARKSSGESTPARRERRRLSTARSWSQTATERSPAEGVGTRIGGWECGRLDSGTTTTVRRARLRPSAVSTMAGRVLRISEPCVGSKATHQTSPRRTTGGGREARDRGISTGGRVVGFAGQPISERRLLPFAHFGGEFFILLNRESRLI